MSVFGICSGGKFWRGDEITVESPFLVPPVKLVIKEARSGQGKGVYFPPDFYDWNEVLGYLREKSIPPAKVVIEERLEQHEILRVIAPQSLNTLRVVTYRDDKACQIWGAYIRFWNRLGYG